MGAKRRRAKGQFAGKVPFGNQFVAETADALRDFATNGEWSSGKRLYFLTEEQRSAIVSAVDEFMSSPARYPQPPTRDLMREHEAHCDKKHKTLDAVIDCNQAHARRMEKEYRDANPEARR